MLEGDSLREGSYKADRLGAALRGQNPTLLARLRSGFVFLADMQFLPGWCVLTAYPQVFDLHCLPFARRNEFLADMQLLGEAIAQAAAPLRMNYSILGNTDAYLHAHVTPRYGWEPPERLRMPAWAYPEATWRDPQHSVGERHLALAQRILAHLEGLCRQHGLSAPEPGGGAMCR
jgi:diadenosine tetraphosphate (Ap4A) HIT family hydrolase